MFNFLTGLKEKIILVMAIVLATSLIIISTLYYFEREKSDEAIADLATKQGAYRSAKVTIEDLNSTNRKNLKEIDKLKELHKKEIDALRQKAHSDAKMIRELTIINERINNASKKDDGPVAPILYNTLYRLQQITTRPADRNGT